MTQSSKWAGLLVLLISLSSFAAADTYTYTYTGNALSTFVGNPPAGVSNISASFTTLDPLAANLAFTGDLSNVSAIAFNISEGDGLDRLNAGPDNLFGVQIATDSTGAIAQWLVFGLNTNDWGTTTLILGTSSSTIVGIYDLSCRGPAPDPTNDYCTNLTFGDSSTYDGGDVAANFDSAGNWSVTENPTPEPSSLLLFGSGIVTLAGAARRRLLR